MITQGTLKIERCGSSAQSPDRKDRERELAESRDRIVEAARRWYTTTNEADLAAAVQDHEHLIKQEHGDG